jgi:hypothetical protein
MKKSSSTARSSRRARCGPIPSPRLDESAVEN